MPVAEQELRATLPAAVVAWQRRAGRHDLPWQNTRDPYAIWVSEIMLQQTQVSTVLAYYPRFLKAFPDASTLARAPLGTVLEYWSGLGYYSRARNLHATAQRVVLEHGGALPTDPVLLEQLPGIGRSTAAAISVFSRGTRAAILDGNVKRVLCRAFAIDGDPGSGTVLRRLWALADALVPPADVEAYTQGMMDLGATLCTTRRPRCSACPLSGHCEAERQGTQEAYPNRRPRRPVPQRRALMLFLHHAGEVLLERRPASGIWGGLWSLPQWEADEVDLADRFAERYGEVQARGAIPTWRHGFTHFELEVDMVALDLGKRTGVERPGDIWLALADVPGAALPAPIKKLLTALWRASPGY